MAAEAIFLDITEVNICSIKSIIYSHTQYVALEGKL
jgi:hypothetical protein